MKERTYLKGMMLALCMLFIPLPAFADSVTYTFPGMQAEFGIPTSTSEKELRTHETQNHDKSKRAAYIPPQFGSMTSYTLDHLERLTPNLIDESVSKDTTGIRQLDDGAGAAAWNETDFSNMNGIKNAYETIYHDRYTALTDEMYYSAGHIGRLSIPAIDVSVKVYEGESQSNMKKGAAHMEHTSFWDGNVVICGHNRGDSNYFRDLHKLEEGDLIFYTTKLGEKVYRVEGVSKVHETNHEVLLPSAEDCMTLLTCVRNESAYRYAVKASRIY